MPKTPERPIEKESVSEISKGKEAGGWSKRFLSVVLRHGEERVDPELAKGPWSSEGLMGRISSKSVRFEVQLTKASVIYRSAGQVTYRRGEIVLV